MSRLLIRGKIAAVLAAFYLTAIPTVATADEVIEHNCGDCDTTSPIDLNYEVRTVINQNVSQWQPGDVVRLSNSQGQTTTWTYTGGGTFVRGATTQSGNGANNTWGGPNFYDVWGNWESNDFGYSQGGCTFEIYCNGTGPGGA